MIQKDAGPVMIDLAQFFPLEKSNIEQELWLRRKPVFLIDGQPTPDAVDFYEPDWVEYRAIRAVASGPTGNVAAQKNTSIITGMRGGTHVPQLLPDKLSPGKHTLTVKILVGPGTAPKKDEPAPKTLAAALERPKPAPPPPWLEEIVLPPIDFEIVDKP